MPATVVLTVVLGIKPVSDAEGRLLGSLPNQRCCVISGLGSSASALPCAGHLLLLTRNKNNTVFLQSEIIGTKVKTAVQVTGNDNNNEFYIAAC